MKSVTSWILESVVATIVFVLCLGIPGALGLPRWTLALSAFPIWLYLVWRLQRPAVKWRFALIFATLLAALFAMQFAVVPAAWRPVTWTAIVVLVVVLAALVQRRGNGSSRAEPGAAPNGGPATPLGNLGATEGPPSVS
jgi:hypothetical protein